IETRFDLNDWVWPVYPSGDNRWKTTDKAQRITGILTESIERSTGRALTMEKYHLDGGPIWTKSYLFATKNEAEEFCKSQEIRTAV
ncbi:MAG: hypothetical protein H7839_24350, partial [Magnetococcus sp. YQC-5]